MNEIEIFKNSQFGEIRVVGTPEQPYFCLSDVCKALELSAKIVNQRLSDEVVSKYPIKDSLGRTQQTLFVNEDGLYDVIFDSRKPEAKAFRKWVTSEVLPSIRKTGSYTVKENKHTLSVQDGLTWVDGVSKLLSLSNSSKLSLLKKFGEPLGLPIPDYVESKGVLHSATELLKKNNINLSARGFNQLAVTNGILREVERKSHNGIKKYKNLTDKGLAYGENQVNPQNPKETQPMYYDDKFMELCSLLGIEPIKD